MRHSFESASAAFSYDPTTGTITRRVTRGGQRAGAIAGFLRKDGYLSTTLDRAEILAHRLAWLLFFGQMPVGEIDHINGVRSDNRIANLRPASRLLNNQNRRRAHSNNRLGILGVRMLREGVFLARIRVNKKLINLGQFDSADKASTAYLSAKRQLHKGNTL